MDSKLIQEVARRMRARGRRSLSDRLWGPIEAHRDLRRFLDTLFSNMELLYRTGAYLPVRPFDMHPAPEVEHEASPEQMEALLARVEETWRRLGERDPDWSVLTADAYRRERIDQNLEAFYDSGRPDAARLMGWLAHNHVDASKLETLLEFGCGTGRVTRWLAPQFARVHACDISRPHLDLARARLAQFGIANTEFHHVAELRDLDGLPEFDALFSIIALQHNPPPVIAVILRKLLQNIRLHGVAFFQVPTYLRGYRFRVSEHLAAPPASEMEMHVLPQHVVFDIAREAGCEPLEVEPDNYTQWPEGVSNTFLLRKIAPRKGV